MKKVKNVFETKTEIVKCLVDEWDYRDSQFYNNLSNKSVEKFWTYNRCLNHLFDLRKNYIKTEHGRTLKEFYENV
jgi:hypothetical protein